MGNVTNKQHYVFQAYLKKWGEKLWCLKKTEKTVFRSSTNDVLNKRQMYKIQEMNDDEKKFFELIMTSMKLTNTDKSEMRSHIKEYLLPFENLQFVEALKKIPIPMDYHLNAELQEDYINLHNLIHKQIVNTEEDFYGDYEGEAIVWINSIIDGNTEFYYKRIETPKMMENIIEDKDSYVRDEFLNFLCIQYFRTVGMRNQILDNIKKMIELAANSKFREEDIEDVDLSFDTANIRPESILPHMVWIIETKCSAGLSRKNADLQIIRNETELPFITSDQPIINMKAELGGGAPDEFVLYYPLSPKVAVTINGGRGERILEKKSEVDNYNKMILDHSFEYVISNKKEVLEGLIDMYL